MVKLLAGGNLEILKYCFGRGLEPGRRRIRGLIAMIQEQCSSSRAVTRSCTDGDTSSDNRGHFHQSWILQWTSQTISIFTNCIWNLKVSELMILTLVGTRRQEEWRHTVAQFLWLRKHCTTHHQAPLVLEKVPSEGSLSPLLGPSPGWKRLLPLSHLRHY